ncbi:hypothetical protein C0J52_16886 [Blattella germanica]|nr:hypothetical protein C0J52_16886 [Blattella germanica]
MVSRLGNVSITSLGNFLLRPGSETSLPPISKDSDGKSSGLGASPASTPEYGFRSALSVENLTSSEPEEARASPHYPTRNKTREDFL